MNPESTPLTLDLSILREGSELDRKSLEILRMPDGAKGAKWGGMVFPVREGDQIELSDRAVPPGQCDPWENSPERWTVPPVPEGADAYLFVDGTAQTRDRAVRMLMDAGISVLRSGPNLSGSTGDWFIRIDGLVDEAKEILKELRSRETKESAQDDVSSLRERLLIQALVAGQVAQAQIRAELERVRNTAIAVPENTVELRALKDSLRAMSERLAEVEHEAQGLRARLEAAPRPAAKENGLEAELSLAAGSLLPRLDFIGNSMNFIAVELPSRSIVWKALAALDRQERGQPEGWKSLSGYSGWWERHFSTGQDNQGRIYARLNGRPARWEVLVSHKQEQAMDLRRIAKM